MDDILIRGATVLDGTGGPPQGADVAIRQGRISAVETGRTETAVQEIDATGSPCNSAISMAPGSASWKHGPSCRPGFQPSRSAHSK